MRRFFLILFIFAAAGLQLAAEENAPSSVERGPALEVKAPTRAVEATYMLKTGERLTAPYAAAYRELEFSQQRGRWIPLDVGYYDIGRRFSQLWFAGVGVEMHPERHVTWTQIVYVAQATGRDTHNERMVWIWPVVDVQLTERLRMQTVVYPTIPLNRAQRWGLDVDRSKLEYKLRPRLWAGVGLNASTGANCPWQKRPFLTATTTRGRQSFEIWAEHIPGGAELQLRYALARKGAF